MYKRFNLGVLLVVLGLYSYSQVSIKDIKFDNKEIDFGSVIIEHGIVTASFSFQNLGSDTFKINDIDVACGCTNPRSDKKIYAPGEMGKITVEFNPKGMTGDVHKWIYVKGNYSDETQINLGFKASLKSLALRNENHYPGELGYLVMKRLSVGYGILKGNVIREDSIRLINEGYRTITVSSAKNLPSWISIDNLPLEIEPQESKALRLTINTTNIDTVGPVIGDIQFITNDQFYPKKSITYRAIFEQDFSRLKRRQLKKAPRIIASSKRIDLGIMKSGELRSKDFTITNAGKSPLIIKRIDTDCNCAVINNLKKEIAPGEVVKVQAQLDTLFKSTRQTKAITLYTNDPQNPKFIISITALVE